MVECRVSLLDLSTLHRRRLRTSGLGVVAVGVVVVVAVEVVSVVVAVALCVLASFHFQGRRAWDSVCPIRLGR